MPPVVKDRLATSFCALGLALSVYLALLKFYSLPCIGPGHCNTVIHSPYGTALGLPVGLFGALLWSGAILVPDGVKRVVLLGMLALGAAGFMGLQFLVLRGFCLYCTLHALMAFGAAAVSKATPRRWAFPLGLFLAGAGFYFTRQAVSRLVETHATTTSTAPILQANVGLPWLGPVASRSPSLVLSLNCPACLNLLDTLQNQDLSAITAGPAIFFKTTDENRALTREFVAAVLSQEGSPRDAFLATTILLLTLKDLALSTPQTAVTQFSVLFPAAAAHRDEAARLLALQAEILKKSQLSQTTPLLISPDGNARAFFKIEDLFPR